MSEVNGPGESPTKWWRNRNAIIAAAVAVVLVAGGVVAAVSISDANARATAAAAAEARAEAERKAEEEVLLKAHKDALIDADAAQSDGEARYSESEVWGDPESRTELRDALENLAQVLERSDSSTEDIEDATDDVTVARHHVGTEAEMEAKKIAAAEAALDQQYQTMAEALKGDGRIASKKGREYCDYLHQYYTPQNVYPLLWGDFIETREIDVAAVRVYCPEFAPIMETVVAGFYDGKHVVGTSITPGTYRTYGSVSDCYWERNDGSGNILDNNYVSSAHNGVSVKLNAGEGFVTQGCGLWVPAG